MKRLTIIEMQIKMTVRCNFISTGMAKIKRQQQVLTRIWRN